MTFRCQLTLLLLTASIVGCSTSSTHVVTLALDATAQNAGKIANATLASQDSQTGFTFFIGGVPNGTTLPLRLYTYINKGSCQQPGPVAFAMNDRIETEPMANARAWTFSRSAPMKMSGLLSGGYSIVVKTTPADGNLDIFCGNIQASAVVTELRLFQSWL